jgi:hypothetical protein
MDRGSVFVFESHHTQYCVVAIDIIAQSAIFIVNRNDAAGLRPVPAPVEYKVEHRQGFFFLTLKCAAKHRGIVE